MAPARTLRRLAVLGAFLLLVAVGVFALTGDAGTAVIVLAVMAAYAAMEGLIWGAAALLDRRRGI